MVPVPDMAAASTTSSLSQRDIGGKIYIHIYTHLNNGPSPDLPEFLGGGTADVFVSDVSKSDEPPFSSTP